MGMDQLHFANLALLVGRCGIIQDEKTISGNGSANSQRGKSMNSSAILRMSALAIGTASGLFCSAPVLAASNDSQVVFREFRSECVARSKVGTDPVRRLAIYLPQGYGSGSKRYPVIYFLPSSRYSDCFEKAGAQALLDDAIAQHRIEGFILVSADMSTPLGCSWYVNSPATGNWDDLMVKEIVPYVDASFRTIPNRDSRGIAGEFMGGYGAIRYGMTHPDIFGSVYAMHPVGTGSGVQTIVSRPIWDALGSATSQDDAKRDIGTQIFVAIFQAHLPDPDKPPLFIDLPARKEGGKLVVDANLIARLRNNFFIASLVPRYAENLRSLRGFKFDWPRNDPLEDHIYSNQALTHVLNEFGIPHEAEEYNGTWTSETWGEDGRFNNDVIPFFHKYLASASD
jgi:pimeloyl-ACP methyl ester carboxylesterase